MRFWSPDFIIKEFDKLVDMGVTTIRISDEMYTLNRKYYVPLSNLLKSRDYSKDLQMWVYARVDSVNNKYLDLMRESGVKWIALGVESIDQKVRQEIYKGSYKEVDIREVISDISNAGISTIANYIFGLPDDDYDTMNRTLDAALELNTEMANMYCATALPGSPLYYDAVKQNIDLPKSFDAWSFHSYDSLPLPTKHLSAAEVLRFRDRAWQMYFSRSEYLSMVESKFGKGAREHVEDMSKIKLKRKLLGD
jgi:radical SAM superfamily enzyme YgiQ (UPF0313 family)